MKRWLIALWILVMVVLHQDFWLWTNKTLVLGFLPMGLAYHACYSVVAAITLFVMTRTIWPKHLEAEENDLPSRPSDGSGH